MKATIKHGGDQAELTLIPETEDDKQALRNFSTMGGSRWPKMISCRGFDYMNPEVEFIVQPWPRND